jgi:hypothetical protein
MRFTYERQYSTDIGLTGQAIAPVIRSWLFIAEPWFNSE